MSTVKATRADGNETRRRLKQGAQRLFATRGVDSVTIKDIVAAAGQRNNASLHYHFGSKEALVAELLLDGAKRVDAARQKMLDAMGADGGAIDVRMILEALVRPVSQITEDEGPGNTYIRFISNLQMNQRSFFRSTLGERWNAGYRRCLELLRELLSDVPAALLEQRLSMMGIYANAIFAAKEAALDETPALNRFWSPAHTLDNIIDTLQAVLQCAPSEATASLLVSAGAPVRRPATGFRPV